MRSGAMLDSFDISEWAEDHSEKPGASKLFPHTKLADIKKYARLHGLKPLTD